MPVKIPVDMFMLLGTSGRVNPTLDTPTHRNTVASAESGTSATVADVEDESDGVLPFGGTSFMNIPPTDSLYELLDTNERAFPRVLDKENMRAVPSTTKKMTRRMMKEVLEETAMSKRSGFALTTRLVCHFPKRKFIAPGFVLLL
jgi:hypothetical protein